MSCRLNDNAEGAPVNPPTLLESVPIIAFFGPSQGAELEVIQTLRVRGRLTHAHDDCDAVRHMVVKNVCAMRLSCAGAVSWATNSFILGSIWMRVSNLILRASAPATSPA